MSRPFGVCKKPIGKPVRSWCPCGHRFVASRVELLLPAVTDHLEWKAREAGVEYPLLAPECKRGGRDAH